MAGWDGSPQFAVLPSLKSLRRRPLGRRLSCLLVWWQWEDPGMLSGNKTERAFSSLMRKVPK